MRMILLGVLAMISSATFAQQLAFPGAEGYGRYATGGRGGTVYHVTNLNDKGAGSFRDAVSQPNRYVVFDVGGVIDIRTGTSTDNNRIVINRNITIAGQTAPGGGITVYGDGIALNGSSGNSVIRYIRFRMGDDGQSRKDALGISDGQNYMFDHVSVSWGWDGTLDVNGTNIDNITFQDCIISQGIDVVGHSTGGLFQSGKWSMFRSLYIDNETRNPKAKGPHEFINCVIYNWGSNGYIMGGGSDGVSECNLIGNYFIYGPSSSAGSHITGTNELFHVYPLDNWIDSNKDGVLNGTLLTDYKTATVETTPFNHPGAQNVMSAEDALYYVMKNAGGSFPARDAVDEFLIEELKSFGKKGAIIVREKDNGIPGNVGTVANGTAPVDTDKDGMPDYFEDLIGFDKNKADHNEDKDGDGYPNIEEYFNCLTCECDVAMEGCAGFKSGSFNIKVNSSDLCLKEKDSYIIQGECDGTALQAFVFTENEDGTFTVKNKSTDKYLTYTSTAEGTEIRTISTQSSAKAFTVVPADPIGYNLSIPNTELLVAVKSGSESAGAKIIITSNPSGKSELLTISNYSPILDCAGTIDGTAFIDDCGVCVGGTTSQYACAGGIGGEEFCASGSVGVFEDTNTGFLGTGYFNFDNQVGSTGSYKIYAKTAGAAEVTFRYANGGTAPRPFDITLNGTKVVSALDFPVTGSWTTWTEVKTTLTFTKGVNDLIFTATTADGGPNLDLIYFQEEGFYHVDCSGAYTLDCFGVPDGDAYLDECAKCVGGKTGKAACVPVPNGISNADFRVYPNPFDATVTVSLDKPASIGVIDFTGKIIEELQATTAGNYSFGKSLNAGLYFLKIVFVDGSISTQKLIKTAL